MKDQKIAIKRISTFEAAVTAIGDFIIGNGLQPGENLLPEPELAAKLGISRNILREALRHYRTLGIIESKPKSGTVIRSLIPENPYAGYFPFFAAQTELVPKLLELRISLETGAAPYIIQHIDQTQITALRHLCDQFKSVKTADSLRQLDCDFHLLFLSAAKNPLLTGLLPLVVEFFRESVRIRKPETSEKALRLNYEQHTKIVNALEKRDPAALRAALDFHYSTYTK